MTTSRHHFRVIHNGHQPHIDCRKAGVGIAAFVVCIVLLLALTQWATSSPSASDAGADPQAPQIGDASLPFWYYPAQYVNQAKEPEEHIQAF